MALSKVDLQLFFKRLRKAHGASHQTIKYYAAGEYGGKTSRPHYHIILFNAQLELIQNAWNKGQVHYGTLTEASVGYTLKYIHKKAFKKKHANDDRQPEFALMSKRLGDNYLTKAAIQWHQNDYLNRMYLVIEDGKKVAMPRYYKEKIYGDDQREEIAEHAQEKAYADFIKLVKKFGKDLNNRIENKRQSTIKKASFNLNKNDKL